MRAAETYRGARRNAVSRRGRFTRFDGQWNAWETANQTANTNGRLSSLANGAREAMSKAIVEQRNGLGSLSHLTHRKAVDYALLAFYLDEKRTRLVNRFVRELRHAVRA